MNIRKSIRHSVFFGGILAALFTMPLSVGAAGADDYPQRPIRIIVPFAAGGGVDFTARLVGESLSKKFGRTVVVENKPGAGGLIAVRETISSPADGYTLFLGAAGEIAINPVLNKQAGYDPKADLTPVAIVVRAPNVLAVNAGVPVDTAEELIEYARNNSASLTFSSSGVGTIQHITGEIFNKVANTNVLHVPYAGAAPAVVDVAGERISMTFSSPGSIAPFVHKGQIKMLAVTTSERYPSLPDLPTVKEVPGMAEFDAESWFAMFAPAGTPPAVVQKLNSAVVEALRDPAIAERLIPNVGVPSYENVEEAKQFVAAEIKKYGAVIDTLNIELQ